MTLPDRAYSISLLSGAATNEAHKVTLTLPQLLAGMQSYQVRESKDGGAWSPITWEGDERADENAEAISCIVLDIDHAVEANMRALCAALESTQWVFVIHETFTAGRYRLVLPLARDLTPGEYLPAWEAVRAALDCPADPQCKDLARLYYLPSHPSGVTRDTDSGGTVLLDPASLARKHHLPTPKPSAPRASGALKIPAAETPQNFSASLDLEQLRGCVAHLGTETRKPLLDALSWKLRLPKGERENPLHQLTSALTTVLPQRTAGDAWHVIKTVFQHVVDTMVDPTLSADEYMAKVRHSFDRAWERRELLEGQAKAARDFFAVAPGEPGAWRGELLSTTDKAGNIKVRACTANLDLILEHDEHFAGHVRFNDLRRRVEITGGVLKASKGAGTYALSLSNWLQRSEYSLDIPRETCGASLLHAAKRHHFNPVLEYLEGLKWDGTSRVSRVLLDLCGAQGNTAYIEDITRKFFISAAARALTPGCKVDTTLVLQGVQGTRKTSFVETLAGGWYTTVNTRVTDKDTQLQATEAWFVELSELASASSSTISSLRGFLTKRVDQIRVPYAEAHEDYERRCVFVGTTNDDQPLIDPDGNRRYWVVACGEIDIRELTRQRDQLWAEAVYLFRQYEREIEQKLPEVEMQHRWWLTREEQNDSDAENLVFQTENPLEQDVRDWLAKPTKKPHHVTITQLLKAMHYSNERLSQDNGLLTRMGKTLKAMGWKRDRVRINNVRVFVFIVPVEVDSESLMGKVA